MSAYADAAGRKSHEIAAQALDGAMAGWAPPPTSWRNLVPPPGWGQALGGGSGNIPWIALVALFLFSKPGSSDERYALDRLDEAEALSRTRWFFGEFGSWIYTGWTLTALLAAACEARRRGVQPLAERLERLLRAWFALALLAAARCPTEGQIASDRTSAGKEVVIVCGMRSWGHGAGLGFGHHNLFRIAFGLEMSKARGEVGAFDGDWPSRVVHALREPLRELARPLATENPRQLAERIVYSPMGSCQLRAYQDGSRVFLVGADEPEIVDEDTNNNTPAILYFCADQGANRLRFAPAWPAPNGGATRIRQKNVRADLDWSGDRWVLRHSDVGVRREGDSWVTDCPEPASPLAWTLTTRGGDGVWQFGGVGDEAPAPRPPQPQPHPPQRPDTGPPPGPPAGAAFDCRLVWYAPGECYVLEGRTATPLVVEMLPPQGEVEQRWIVKRATA